MEWKKTKSHANLSELECYICGGSASEMHHMLHGTFMRAKADKYGLVIPLCRRCHNMIHDKGIYDKALQQTAQRIFEEDHTREEFIKEFGKSFL